MLGSRSRVTTGRRGLGKGGRLLLLNGQRRTNATVAARARGDELPVRREERVGGWPSGSTRRRENGGRGRGRDGRHRRARGRAAAAAASERGTSTGRDDLSRCERRERRLNLELLLSSAVDGSEGRLELAGFLRELTGRTRSRCCCRRRCWCCPILPWPVLAPLTSASSIARRPDPAAPHALARLSRAAENEPPPPLCLHP